MKVAKTAIVAAASGVLAGTLGAFALIQSPMGGLDQRIAAALDAGSTDQTGASAPDFGARIEAYLIENPSVLERVSVALNAERAADQRRQMKSQIEDNRDAIFGDAGGVVVGNPSGDVTLVELYDYNCGYCRTTLPDIVALLDQDPKLRLVLRPFPILSQGSVDAAKVGAVVAGEGGDFAFHQAMFTSRGQIDLDAALSAAANLGLDPAVVRGKLDAPEVQSALDASFKLAQRLGIRGTPTFVLGDEIISGAVGLDTLRTRIANVRQCGSTSCPQPEAGSP